MEEMSQEEMGQSKKWHHRPATLGSVWNTIIKVATGVVVVGGALSPLLLPAAKSWVQAAVAGEIKNEVKAAVTKEVSPLVAAQKAQLQGRIEELEDEISDLEFRRDLDRSKWTQLDAKNLTRAQQRLRVQKEAKAALEKAQGAQ